MAEKNFKQIADKLNEEYVGMIETELGQTI